MTNPTRPTISSVIRDAAPERPAPLSQPTDSALPSDSPRTLDRRRFLQRGGAAAAAGALVQGLAPSVYAAGSDILKVGLIGCGGRGTGAAAQALNADPNSRLVAMGDAFRDRLESSLNALKNQAAKDRVAVDAEHQFVGFDAYKHVIDSVDVVLLTTPPHFRPQHLRYAVEKNKHVFVEKPVAVDGPGIRSMFDTVELARQKGLSIVSGLCWRYHYGMRATFEQIHKGTLGEITAMQCSYNTRGLWLHKRKPEWSEMEYQLRNWLYYTWLSGDHITEQHVHSLDKMGWALHDVPPVKVSGTGGRQTRTSPEYGHIFDHFAVVFEYANGIKVFSRCRQQNGCAVDVSDHVFGTKGRADVFRHTIYDWKGNVVWKFDGKRNNMYQTEHDEFFASIRSGKPINNGDYMTKSTLMAIMGRMAAYTGQTISWEQALNSQEDLSPPAYDWIDLPTPPVAMPGITPFA